MPGDSLYIFMRVITRVCEGTRERHKYPRTLKIYTETRVTAYLSKI